MVVTEPGIEPSAESSTEDVSDGPTGSMDSMVKISGAPLWLPGHDAIVVDQLVARPPDVVEGYGLADRLKSIFFGSPWQTAVNVATTLVLLLFVISLVTLQSGIGGLIKVSIYQAWTLGLLLVATKRVRSVSVVSLVRYWLAGMFVVGTAVHFVSGPLSRLAGRPEVFVYPVLEELLKASLLIVAVLVGRRLWRHPGLSDFLVLGFAIGGGYGFHAAGLRTTSSASGFDVDFGFLVPSTLRADGLFVAGHAVAASLVALAIGLIVLHRHQSAPVVAGALLAAVTVLDRMASADGEGALNWVRSLTFGGTLLACLFVVALVASVVLDRRRLAATSDRDHLFPPANTRPVAVKADEGDLLSGVRIGQYRRLRNGMHNTVDATAQQWPPLSEANAPPLAELTRLAQSAGIAAGPGSSSSGWTPDSDEPGRYRFAGPYGFTAFGAGDDLESSGPLPAVAVINDPSIDGETRAAMQRQLELAEQRASRGGRFGPTTTTLSAERAGENVERLAMRTRHKDYWQYVGLAVVAVVLFIVVRLLTAGDLGDDLVTLPLHLPETTAISPIVCVLGGIAAAVALRGRDHAQFGSGWDVGPGEDPRPVRPRECEA